jgi:hypothetical protein
MASRAVRAHISGLRRRWPKDIVELALGDEKPLQFALFVDPIGVEIELARECKERVLVAHRKADSHRVML